MTQTIEIIGGGGGDAIEIGGAGERSATISVTGSGALPVPHYTGPYEFTPTEETQTVSIARKQAAEDIIIHTIPQNYGLVTYNGSIITIS